MSLQSFKKRYQKSDVQAKKIGKIGEKLANAYLTEKYNDEKNGGKVIHHYFEVKVTGIPDKKNVICIV